MYGQAKIHKTGNPLREIVDANGGVTRPTNGHISTIIKKYTEDNKYSIKNSKEFVDQLKDVKLKEGETLVSFDVVALYPSVPQDEALDIVFHKLKNDEELHKRTKLKPESIMRLFKLCVQNTYFSFNGRLYMQVNGLAMGAPTSGFTADIYGCT